MAVKERIAGIRSDEIGAPVGAYRIELHDDRGRVKERVEATNYITPVVERFARWAQATAILLGDRYVHLGAASHSFPASVGGGRPIDQQPMIPNESIVALSSAAADDEDSDWVLGRVIGWASRWKSASVPASGQRGQINEAQSELTLSGAKLVYDFNENQGNGEFASMAIGRVAQTTPATLTAVAGASRYFSGINPTTLSTADAEVAGFDLAAGKAYLFNSSTRQVVPVSLAGSSLPLGVQGWESSTADTPSSTFASLTSTTSGVSTGVGQIYRDGYPALVKSGSDWILAYSDGRGNLMVGKWANTGARAWATALSSDANTTPERPRVSVTVIGTDAYVIGDGVLPNVSATAARNVHRVRLSDGVLTATMPLGLDQNGNDRVCLGGITTDGTDLLIHCSDGIVRMSTAGVILEWLGLPVWGELSESTVSPWSSLARVYYPSQARDAAYYIRSGLGSTITYDMYSGGAVVFPGTTNTAPVNWISGLHCEAGKLYGFRRNVNELLSIDGSTGLSRSLLDAPVIKTPSSTMKWTYEITFPDGWHGVPLSPPDVPS